jgi:hypothetical protein
MTKPQDTGVFVTVQLLTSVAAVREGEFFHTVLASFQRIT